MFRTVLILLLITSLAAILRFANFSPFTIYPDSYQNLVVAENLKTYGSILGYLGPGGMLYPQFFMWTRPVFAGLVAIFGNADLIALFLGIAAIPLSYFTYRSLSPNPYNLSPKIYPLAAALLLALSFNHTVWSGFIMTEPAGVFFMLLFLWSLFSRVGKKTYLFNPKDLLTGFLFALAIFTRYEYVIIILPVLYLIKSLSPNPYNLIPNILISSLTIISLTILTLYPWQSAIPVLFTQLSDLIIRAGIIVAAFIIITIIYHLLKKSLSPNPYNLSPNLIPNILIVFLLLFAIAIYYVHDFTFILAFAEHDFLIAIFTLIGYILMLRNKQQRLYAYFSLMAVASLAFIYNRINPEMERYMTHTIPFLLIPASFGIVYFTTSLKIKNLKLKIFRLAVFGLMIFQILQTADGLRYLQDPSWYRTSYEEKVAVKLSPYTKNNPVLLVAMPEPYFLKTKLTTQSINDNPPHLYIDEELNNKEVIIVQDTGMRDIFPTFNKLIDTKLQKYKVGEFYVKENYHTTIKSIPEKEPVKVYRIKLLELRKLII